MAIGTIANAESGSSVRTKLNSSLSRWDNRDTYKINVADHGVLPSNTAAQNDTALIAMRDGIWKDYNSHYHIYFPPGDYVYTNNRWMWGVLRYTLDAYGCTFENTANTTWTYNDRPFQTGNYWDDRGDVARTGGNDNYVSGSLIETTTVGASTVTLVTTAEHSDFGVGDRVIVYGYCQQFDGFPPHVRYHELHTISAIDTGTGVITFEDPLNHFYDSTWPDFDGTADNGAPRVLNIDRTNFKQPIYAHLKGAKWLPNQNNSAAKILVATGDTVIYEDMEFKAINPTSSRYMEVRRCISEEALSIDKHVETFIMEGCHVLSRDSGSPGISGSTNFNKIVLRRNTIYGQLTVNAYDVTVEDNVFYGNTSGGSNIILLNGSLPSTFNLILKGNVFRSRVSGSSVVGNGQVTQLTVGSVSGTDILLTWNAAAQEVAEDLMVGQTLYRDDGVLSGVVTNITHDGGSPGNLVISGNWPTPTAAETWEWRAVEHCVDLGGNRVVELGSAITGIFQSPEKVEGATQSMFIPAKDMQPTTTSGCAALAQVELTAGNPELYVLDFDSTADEFAQFNVVFPIEWNRGALRYRAYWTCANNVTTGIAIGLQARTIEQGEQIHGAYGTAVLVTADYDNSGAHRTQITPISAAVSPNGNNPAGPSHVYFKVYRDVSDANDDMTQDMRLMGIELFWVKRSPSELAHYKRQPAII